jgi:hypothetical protein
MRVRADGAKERGVKKGCIMKTTKFVGRYWRHKSIAEIDTLAAVKAPKRGLYALFNKRGRKFDVVYIGMTRSNKSGFRTRLWAHKRSTRKYGKWSHFSVFELKTLVTNTQIKELEGLLREIFALDRRAMGLNRQKRYGPFKKLSKRTK